MTVHVKDSVWNDAVKVEALINLFNQQKFSASQIAAKLGLKSKNQVISKLHRMGYGGKGTPRKTELFTSKHKGWSDQEVETLETMWAENSSVQAIAIAVGRTVKAVKNKSAHLGLKPRNLPRHATVARQKPVYSAPRPVVCEVTCSPVTLERRTGCCFPTNNGGPYLFCNNAGKVQSRSGESIYCDGHWQFMHRNSNDYHGAAVKSAHREFKR